MKIRVVLPVVAVLLALLASACGSSSSTKSGSGGGGGTVLTVARTGDIDGLDPHVATAFQTLQGLELVYDTLFEQDKDLKTVPGLAEKWEYSADGKKLTIHLRSGVTFHSGAPFTSADVKASLERILDPKTGAVLAANLASIKKIAAPDDATVVLDLSTADASLPAALSHVSTAIMSVADIKSGAIKTKPDGTGPFSFGNWAQGDTLHLVANAKYWGGAPKLKGVDIRVVPDESSILAGLRAHQFNIGVLSDPTVVSQVKGGDLKLESTPSLSYYVFAMNATRGPLKDERVRQALSCAINRQEVIDSAAAGEGRVTGPFTSPSYKFPPFEGLPCTPPDAAATKRLLAEAGFPNGFTINSIVLTGEHGVMPNIAQSVQAQLQKVGVKLKTQMLETNTFVERWKKADFDSYITINSGFPDPHQMYVRYFNSKGNLNQVAKYHSPEVDSLMAKGLAQTDAAARTPIYRQLSEQLLKASAWVWLFGATEDRVLAPGVQGFIPMPNGSLKSLRQTTLSQ
jgi:peptide/nickel transport system substrate-binding protein